MDEGTQTESTPSERPTFEEAFAASEQTVEESLSSETPETAEETPKSASADATEPPTSEPPVAEDVAKDTGPIPLDRHKKILDGAYAERDTAKKDFEGYKQKFGWAEQVDQSAVPELMEMGRLLRADPPALIRKLLTEASANPELAPLVRSEAARALGSRPAQAPEAPSLEPDIPVLDGEGREVNRTYSAERVQQIVQHAITEALGKELAPLKSEYETRQHQEAAREATRKLEVETSAIYTKAVDVLPGFKEHEADIAKVFESMDVPDGDFAYALHKAWKQVVGGTLSNAAQTKAQTLDELKTKAAASTVNPASASVTTKHRPTSFDDPSLVW